MWWDIVAVVIGEIVLIGWIVWVVTRRGRERAELRAQVHLKLLERFGTASELADFLNSEAGRRFLASFAGERSPAARGILRAVHAGIGFSCLGLGLVAAWFVVDEEPLAVAAAGALALGLGFLLAAVASMRLSRRLGLTLPEPDA